MALIFRSLVSNSRRLGHGIDSVSSESWSFFGAEGDVEANEESGFPALSGFLALYLRLTEHRHLSPRQY